MGSLFKRTYRDRAGTMRRTAKWYGQWTDAAGSVRCVPLSEHRPTAERLFAELIRRDDFARHGLPSPVEHAHSATIDEHLASYTAYLQARGSTAKHQRQQVHRVARVLDAAGLTRPEGITEDAVVVAIGRLRNGYRTTGRGASSREVSTQTARAYLVAVKGFTRWLHRRARRLQIDPLAGAELGGDTAKGRRLTPTRRRRSLTSDEFDRLVASARASAVVFRGLDGESRAMLYTAALHTGFRVSELASLTAESLSTDPPAVSVTHDGRSAVQPVRPDFAAALAAWVRDNPPRLSRGKLWPGTWCERAAGMLRLDLEAAGIPHTTDAGVIDFHALRGSFITLLIAAGHDPKTVQSLARHKQIALTMDIYARVVGANTAAALVSLPAVAACSAATDKSKSTQTNPTKSNETAAAAGGRRKRETL